MKKAHVRWKRSSEGYVESHDGRWYISPLYMGTTRPQGYQIRDMKTGKVWSGDKISDLKWDVENRVQAEMEGKA